LHETRRDEAQDRENICARQRGCVKMSKMSKSIAQKHRPILSNCVQTFVFTVSPSPSRPFHRTLYSFPMVPSPFFSLLGTENMVHGDQPSFTSGHLGLREHGDTMGHFVNPRPRSLTALGAFAGYVSVLFCMTIHPVLNLTNSGTHWRS
jgi:hypothetical protein